MRVGIYARVSTRDKDQNPETQLLPLREFAASQGWSVIGEFVDHASANNLKARTAWRELLDQAGRRRLDFVLVWRIDRAFRSVLDAATTLERLKTWGVGLRSYSEPWLDTTSPFGEVLYYITAAYAQLERAMIQERVKAGMERARRQGKRLGRPRAISSAEWEGADARVRNGRFSLNEAARVLGVSVSTVARRRSQKGVLHGAC